VVAPPPTASVVKWDDSHKIPPNILVGVGLHPHEAGAR
jgi:hypothetical protein